MSETVIENEVVTEVPGGEDFATLFEASYAAHRIERLTHGQTVEGTIVAIGPEVVLVDASWRAMGLLCEEP